jgi:hypothetical protein
MNRNSNYLAFGSDQVTYFDISGTQKIVPQKCFQLLHIPKPVLKIIKDMNQWNLILTNP